MKKKSPTFLEPEVDDFCDLLAKVILHSLQKEEGSSRTESEPRKEADHGNTEVTPNNSNN